MSTLTCSTITDPRELALLAPAWWDLWRRCPSATPFQSPAWLLPWWDAFAPGDLFTIAVHRGERLVGLAPCYIEAGGLGRRILPLGISISDYLDILVDPDAADLVAAALVHWVDSGAAAWDVWEFPDLPPDAAGLALPCPLAADDLISVGSPCPVALLPPFPGTTDHLLSGTKRRKLRMARHRAARRGTATMVRADATSAAGIFSALARLHGLRWHLRSQSGVLADPSVIMFHQRAVPCLLKAGFLRLYALAFEDRIAAVYYGLSARGCTYSYLSGFDPEFAFESPGVLLLDHVISDAIREGVREFHFLRGQESYKYDWGASDRFNRHRAFKRRRTHALAG